MRSPNRPPPLIVMAATALVAIVVIGVVLFVGRSREVPSEEPDPVEDAPASAPPAPPVPPPPAAEAPVPSPPGVREGPATELQDAGADALPVWARPPKPFVTPYPPGGAYNPPLPPVKLLPGMLDPGTPLPDGAVLQDPNVNADPSVPTQPEAPSP